MLGEIALAIIAICVVIYLLIFIKEHFFGGVVGRDYSTWND